MIYEKEKTAHNASVGAEDRQSNPYNNAIISDTDDDFKDFADEDEDIEEQFERMQRMLDPNYLCTVTMSELYDNVYQNKPPIIDGLLYRGTYLFAGAPKIGKSFLMAQLAYHVSTGTPLWSYPVKQSPVLYLALEDTYERLQRRMYQMFGTDCSRNLHLTVCAGQVGTGLETQISNFLEEQPYTSLVIIDTLQKVREAGGESYSYASDYDIISRLKNFADAKGICLVLVHHTRKQRSEDKFDMISGTNGLLGAADGAFLLRKEDRTSNEAILDISGRDQQDQRLELMRDPNTLTWTLERAETELWKRPPEPLLESVSSFLVSTGERWTGSPTELVALLGVDMKPNTLTMKLNINAGRLMNEYGIRYESSRCHDGRRITFCREKT